MKYFTIEELCKSKRAIENGIKNVPTEEHKKNMIALIENVLDPAREQLGKPITTNSGYRSKELNAITPKASSTSQHSKGQAADLICHNNFELIRILQEQDNFDQLIWECGKSAPSWIHVSYRPDGKNRHEKLRTHDCIHYFHVAKF